MGVRLEHVELPFVELYYVPGFSHIFFGFKKIKEITLCQDCVISPGCSGLHGDVSLGEDITQRPRVDKGECPCGNIQIFCSICFPSCFSDVLQRRKATCNPSPHWFLIVAYASVLLPTSYITL